MASIHVNSVVKQCPDLITQRIDGDVVMFSIEKGKYYGAEEIGSRIWDLLSEPLSVSDLCDKLLMEYEVDRETCEAHVVQFLQQLLEEELIEVQE